MQGVVSVVVCKGDLFCRTGLDFFIGVIHIASRITKSAQEDDNVCKVFGALLQFALFSSSAWYFALAIDLLFSIRNPFRYNCVFGKLLLSTCSTVY